MKHGVAWMSIVSAAIGGGAALGAPQGLGQAPCWSMPGGQASGTADVAAFAGDVDGDGYDDALVAQPQHAATLFGEGRVQLFRGGAGGLSPAPSWSKVGGLTGVNLGRSVAAAGDVNGDGFSDVVIGGIGRAFVHYGSSAGLKASPVWSVVATQSASQYGRAVAGAGDVNGDGFDDVAIAEPFHSNALPMRGRVLVYHGTKNGLSVVPFFVQEGEVAHGEYGAAIAGAGDVNGDGYDDLLVGARTHSNLQTEEGKVFLYFGSATGLKAAGAWTRESNQNLARYGGSVAAAGDVNGDGYADFLVGAADYDGALVDEGRAELFLGAAGGPAATPAWFRHGGQAEARFGVVAGGGDVDGDGKADVAIGSRQYDGYCLNEGRVQVFRGIASGLEGPVWTASGNQHSALFGSSVAMGGDFDGDGKGDVFTGAAQFDSPALDEGKVFAFRGGAGAAGGAAAAVSTYGTGKPGSLGPVQLSALGLPRLGWTSGVKIQGGTFGSPPLLFLGPAPASVPFQGGSLLVVPQFMTVMPFTDFFGKTQMNLDVPYLPVYAGAQVSMQVLFPPAGAQGWTMSNGMTWTLGY